jgi:hypothetical protein
MPIKLFYRGSFGFAVGSDIFFTGELGPEKSTSLWSGSTRSHSIVFADGLNDIFTL